MGFIGDMKGMQYRIRIFDNGYHIKTIKIKARGQKFVTANLDNALLGGNKTKLAFMIPTGIRPLVFKGKEMEFSYDIRDAVPMGDLTELVPDLVSGLSSDVHKILPDRVIDADFTPYEEEPVSVSSEEESSVSQQVNETEKTPAQKIKKGAKTALNVTKDAGSLIKIVAQLNLSDEDNELKANTIKKVLDLCARYPKALYWLPEMAGIGQEIQAIVSAKAIYAVGISPSYYAAESTAQISEKVLARPNPKKDWMDVVIMAIAACTFLVTLFFLAKFMHVM